MASRPEDLFQKEARKICKHFRGGMQVLSRPEIDMIADVLRAAARQGASHATDFLTSHDGYLPMTGLVHVRWTPEAVHQTVDMLRDAGDEMDDFGASIDTELGDEEPLRVKCFRLRDNLRALAETLATLPRLPPSGNGNAGAPVDPDTVAQAEAEEPDNVTEKGND